MENSQLISVDKLPELLKHDYTFIDLRDPLQFNKIHLRTASTAVFMLLNTPSINNFIDEIMLIYYHNNRSKLPYSHKVHIFCDIIGT